MKNDFKLIVLCILLTIINISCKKDADIKPLDIGYEYYPDKAGKYIIYDVDSIVMNTFTTQVDTFKFQLKEVIESVYTDNSGRPTMRLERYRKNYNKTTPYDQLPWVITDVWSANRTATSVERLEENIRYVRLIFPIEKNKTWKGNIYNSLSEWNYKYTEINKATTIGGLPFDSTLTVIQINEENLIEKQYYREIYAKNVGLVYKQIIDVQSNLINSQPIMQRVTGGIISYSQTVRAYGD